MTARVDPLIRFCRAMAGATEDVKWGNNLIFSIGGKMFAGFGLPDLDSLGFPVEPGLYPHLIEEEGIEPHQYMARHHWVQVPDRTRIDRKMLEGLLGDAHRRVAGKLSKRKRKELGILEPE